MLIMPSAHIFSLFSEVLEKARVEGGDDDTCEQDGVIGRAAHQPESEGDIRELVEGGHQHAEHQDGQEVPGKENHQS